MARNIYTYVYIYIGLIYVYIYMYIYISLSLSVCIYMFPVLGSPAPPPMVSPPHPPCFKSAKIQRDRRLRVAILVTVVVFGASKPSSS